MAASNSKDNGGPVPAAATQMQTPTTFARPADVVAAYHAGKLTYKQAGDILIAKGWAAPDQVAAPAAAPAAVTNEPSVPISR